jgi:hypothetical protein
MAEIVESGDEGDGRLSMTALAQARSVFAFLADEPDLYTDSDTVERNG